MWEVGFPTGRDSATFREHGTEVSSLSRDKGTTGQAKNLIKGRDGPGQPKFGTGRAGTAKFQDGTRDKTYILEFLNLMRHSFLFFKIGTY